MNEELALKCDIINVTLVMKDDNFWSAKTHVKGYRLLAFSHMLAKVNYYGYTNVTLGRYLILSLEHLSKSGKISQNKTNSQQNKKYIFKKKVKSDKALGKPK